jgi:hypothetical protein
MVDVAQQQSTPPANALEARSRLDTLIADKDLGAKVLSGDTKAAREFSELSSIAAGTDDNTIAKAMSGDIGEFPDSSVKQMAGVAGMLREVGVSEAVIEETLRGKQATPQEYKLVEAWKTRQMGDPAFVKAYLSGDPEARQKMTLAAIVLSGSVKDAQGRF